VEIVEYQCFEKARENAENVTFWRKGGHLTTKNGVRPDWETHAVVGRGDWIRTSDHLHPMHLTAFFLSRANSG